MDTRCWYDSVCVRPRVFMLVCARVRVTCGRKYLPQCSLLTTPLPYVRARVCALVTWVCRCVIRDMTHPWLIHAWYDSFMYVTWVVHVCDMTHFEWLISSDVGMQGCHVSYLMCHITGLTYVMWQPMSCVICHVSYHSSTSVTWPIHTWGMTYVYVWHDQRDFFHLTLFVCDITYSYVWHDSSMCATWLISKSNRSSHSARR